MSKKVKLKSIISGNDITVIQEIKASGTKKNVFFSPDKSFVVGVYKEKPDANSMSRLNDLVTKYKDGIFSNSGGDYWNKVFCWPTDIVETPSGKIGVVMPFFPSNFLFEKGNQKGTDKKGSWFTKPTARKFLANEELGSWKKYIESSLHLVRAIRRLHMAGLSHSDLSYNNVLIDPKKGKAMIIDIDELVVPNKYPPSVIGTMDFIAPEVMKTSDLSKDKRIMPSTATDLHALAVLIYMYLLYRNPVKGRLVHHKDPNLDSKLHFGDKALFVEHSTDKSNKPKTDDKNYLPWSNVDKYPYSLTGRFLSKLFKTAFEEGLHDPEKRPIASEWEDALIKTHDLLVKCGNNKCEQKWFVLNKEGKCPFCDWKYKNYSIPVLNLYKYNQKKSEYIFTRNQIVAFNGKRLHAWHAFDDIVPNESTENRHKPSVGYFQRHQDKWFFVNTGLDNLIDATTNNPILKKNYVEINQNSKLIFGKKPHGIYVNIKMIKF